MITIPFSVDALLVLVNEICAELSKNSHLALIVKQQAVRKENISITGAEGTLWLQLYAHWCDIGMNGTKESNPRLQQMETMFGRLCDGCKQTKPEPHQLFWRCTTTKELIQAIHFYAGSLGHPSENNLYPDEVDSTEQLVEGATTSVVVNRFERNPEARKQCIAHHGTCCKACGLDFERVYGSIGNGFIHVHHVVPVNQIGSEYVINPLTDLVPLCPNCHAMVHRFLQQNPGTEKSAVERLKQLLTVHTGR